MNLLNLEDTRDRNLGRVLYLQAKAQPDATCLLMDDRAYSFAEVNTIVNRYANGLQRLGLRPGDRVSIFMPGCEDFIFLAFAIKVAAVEYAGQRIRFNSIAPGLIHTDMTEGYFAMDAVIQAHVDETPVGRMGTLDDVAEAVLFLADDSRSGYVNGQLLDVAGGQNMGRLPRFEGL